MLAAVSRGRQSGKRRALAQKADLGVITRSLLPALSKLRAAETCKLNEGPVCTLLSGQPEPKNEGKGCSPASVP